MKSRRGRLGCWLAVIMLAWAAPSWAAEFQAQVVTRSSLGEITGRVYYQGENIRQESSLAGVSTVAILRGREKKLWVLVPGRRSYVEMPFTEEGVPGLLTLPKSGTERRFLGEETVQGFRCDMYASSISFQGQKMPQTVWVAKELKVPIKMVSADGSLSSELRDIQVKKLDPALFSLPAGYEKLAFPLTPDPQGGGGRKRQFR